MTDDPNHSSRRRSRAQGRQTKRKKSESLAEMIDRLLMQPVQMTVGDERRGATALEAIMLQLTQKGYAGDIRANRVLLLYREFAEANSNWKPRLTFVDGDYTRAVAKSRRDNDD